MIHFVKFWMRWECSNIILVRRMQMLEIPTEYSLLGFLVNKDLLIQLHLATITILIERQ
jgi:hypothetical protein